MPCSFEQTTTTTTTTRKTRRTRRTTCIGERKTEKRKRKMQQDYVDQIKAAADAQMRATQATADAQVRVAQATADAQMRATQATADAQMRATQATLEHMRSTAEATASRQFLLDILNSSRVNAADLPAIARAFGMHNVVNNEEAAACMAARPQQMEIDTSHQVQELTDEPPQQIRVGRVKQQQLDDKT